LPSGREHPLLEQLGDLGERLAVEFHVFTSQTGAPIDPEALRRHG